MPFKEPRKHSDNVDKDLHDDFVALDKEEQEEEIAKHRLDIDKKKGKGDGWQISPEKYRRRI